MDEKATKRIRKSLTNSMIFASVLSLIGSIGLFICRGAMNSANFQRDNMFVYVIIGAALWDLVRLGSFGMFAGSVILTVCELFGNVRGKYCSMVMVGGSVFGLIGAVKMSFSSVKEQIGIMYGTGGMSGSTSYYSENTMIWSVVFVPCIFAMISAIVIFITIGMRSALENGTYAPPQGYPQYQQYPQNGQMPYVQPPQVPAAQQTQLLMQQQQIQQQIQQQQQQVQQQIQQQQSENNNLNGGV